jgi:hypothetical protein
VRGVTRGQRRSGESLFTTETPFDFAQGRLRHGENLFGSSPCRSLP